MEEVHKKIINWHNEVHTYWHQFWHHISWSLKTLKMSIEIIFGQFCWPSYLTSKLTSISVNLIMSIFFFLWTSSIVCMFDFLIFDIFLTTWHLFDILTHQLNLNHLSPHRAIFNHSFSICKKKRVIWEHLFTTSEKVRKSVLFEISCLLPFDVNAQRKNIGNMNCPREMQFKSIYFPITWETAKVKTLIIFNF